MEPHDISIAKYVALREKDFDFNRALAQRGLVTEERLLQLVPKTPVTEDVRDRIRGDISNAFR